MKWRHTAGHGVKAKSKEHPGEQLGEKRIIRVLGFGEIEKDDNGGINHPNIAQMVHFS